MELQRFRWYRKIKKGISFWEAKPYIEHKDAVTIHQEINNVVIANLPDRTKTILNISYPSPRMEGDGKIHAYGYVDSDDGQQLVASLEHWVWEKSCDT